VQRSEPSGIAAILLATTAFSWGFIIVKALPLEAPVIALWRLAIGAAFLGALAVTLRVPWPAHWKTVLAAGLVFGVHQIVFILATKTTSVAIVTLVGALQPLLVAVVSHRVVGEAVPRALGAWAVLACAGVGIVVVANLDHESRSLGGDLLAALNVVVFTVYFLLAKRARQEGAPTLTFTAGFLAAALLVVAPAAVFVGAQGGAEVRIAPGLPEIALLVLLALVPGNGHLLLNWAHTRVRAALASILLAAVPLLASIWAHLVFGEPYGLRHLAGIFLVITAVEGARRAEARFTRAMAGEAAARIPAPLP
jgi:drug/metabolite transporter (DMT)-like permease